MTFLIPVFALTEVSGSIRILVITGGHDYNIKEFNRMLGSMAPEVTYEVAEFPEAFGMLRPENREKYDVVVFYHMWQDITDDQKNDLINCIKDGKPLIALHHSICAFDNWPEYWNIIGGKYFHKATFYRGIEYPACSYIHDISFNVKIVDTDHPVTRGVDNFVIFDETYKGYYVADEVTPLLITDEESSNPVIGWTKKYGRHLGTCQDK